MVNRYMKYCSTSLIMRETQIQTTVRFPRTPVRLATINKSTNKCWRGCRERGTLEHCSGGIQIGAATVENIMEIPPKIKNRTLMRPGNPTSGYSSKEIQNTNSKRDTNLFVHCSVIYNSQGTETKANSSLETQFLHQLLFEDFPDIFLFCFFFPRPFHYLIPWAYL